MGPFGLQCLSRWEVLKMFFLQWLELLSKGGWVAYVLAALCLALWYALGLRYFSLQTSHFKKMATKKQASDFFSHTMIQLQKVWSLPSESEKEFGVRTLFIDLQAALSIGRQTIRTVVIVAPLLGLLGTVIGMIETFSSLQDSALFSQSGGIAGGISQALITTQMGLVVAIPGLLMGRKMDQKQEQLEEAFEHQVRRYQAHQEVRP